MPNALEPKNEHLQHKKYILYLLTKYKEYKQDIPFARNIKNPMSPMVNKPCLAKDCAFLYYQNVFFPGEPKWLLPSLPNQSICTVCFELNVTKKFTYSNISVRKNNTIKWVNL